MYCSKCGNKNIEGANFCTNCGNTTKLGKNMFSLHPIVISVFLWLSSIALMIWIMFWIFGFETNFDSASGVFWFVFKVLILVLLPFRKFEDLVDAVKEKKVVGFLREEWFVIIILLGLIWVLFADGIV